MKQTSDELVIHQVFSDMIYTTFPEIKEKGSKTYISRTIMELNKFYEKRKMTVIEDAKLLKATKDKYLEKVETIRNYSLNTEYSMSILIIAMLDYLINVVEDKTLKEKFGHKSLLSVLDECERQHRTLTFNSYKLINHTFKW